MSETFGLSREELLTAFHQAPKPFFSGEVEKDVDAVERWIFIADELVDAVLAAIEANNAQVRRDIDRLIDMALDREPREP